MSEQRVTSLWYQRPPRIAYALLPLALVYATACAVRRSLYRRQLLPVFRPRVPVIVVGNIVAGGTGKTPLTQWLATRLTACGRRPGVVSRSYGARAQSPARVAASDDPALRGDEPVLLAAGLACPVWSGPDRVATARALLQAHPEVDVLVCDDGLQHYALGRDVEIAVVDAARGFGNGLLIPAGPLREPTSRLDHVDAIVLNGTDECASLPRDVPVFPLQLRASRLRNLALPDRSIAPEALHGQRLVAIAGIGNPARFFSQLRGFGLEFEAHPFPDHHRYRPDELRFAHADAIVMTDKDAINCAAFADARMWAVPVEAEVNEDLVRTILDLITAGSI